MKQQKSVNEGLLQNMLSSYDASMNFQKSITKRFVLAAGTFGVSKKSDQYPIFENTRYIGTFNARFDQFGKDHWWHDVDRFNNHFFDQALNNLHLFRGDFVLVIYDKLEDKLVIARDQIGIRPIYYLESSKMIAFASEIAPLKEIDSIEIDDLYLSDCITGNRSESYRTFYKEIHKLEPAEQLIIKKQAVKTKYWDLGHITVPSPESIEEAAAHFYQLLYQAVKRRTNSAISVGTELSGGLDSAGISSLVYAAIQDRDIPFHAFSHGLPESSHGVFFPFRDERKFSMEVCDYLGTKEHSIISGKGSGIINSLKQDILFQCGPSQGSYHILSDALLRSVKEKEIRSLFSGHGGDEGVSAKNAGLYQELIDEAEWDKFRYYFLHDNSVSFKKNLKYVLLKFFPISRNWLLNSSDNSSRKLNAKLENFAVNQLYRDHRLLLDRTKRIRGREAVQSMKWSMRMRLKSSAFAQRLEFSYHSARQFNIEYLYPLLDLDLIEYYYHLPSRYKTIPGMDRYIYREAMKGKIPENIRRRKDKFGNTIPSIQLRIFEDHKAIEDLIKRSMSRNKFHYLDYKRLLNWQNNIENRKSSKHPVYPVVFLNSLQILLLQEMEREGEFKSGIRT